MLRPMGIYLGLSPGMSGIFITFCSKRWESPTFPTLNLWGFTGVSSPSVTFSTFGQFLSFCHFPHSSHLHLWEKQGTLGEGETAQNGAKQWEKEHNLGIKQGERPPLCASPFPKSPKEPGRKESTLRIILNINHGRKGALCASLLTSTRRKGALCASLPD